MELNMKISNSNILNQPFSSGRRYIGSISVLFMVLTVMLWGISHLAYAASSHSVEQGIEAFKQGDFTRARSVLSQYVDAHTVDTSQIQVYLFAMEETPTTTLSTHMIQDIVHRSAEGDSIFKSMEARLHLLGVHPHANTQEGIKILESLAHTQGYAAYTLGLYFEGALDGIKRDESKAKGWYETAQNNHYVQAMVKLYALAKDGKICGPASKAVRDQPFHQIPNQRKTPKSTGTLTLEQYLPIVEVNVRSGKVPAGKTLASVPESAEAKDKPKPTSFTLFPVSSSTPTELVIICREDHINRHPPKTLEDTLPDLLQRPIQNQPQTHPINPIDQGIREGLTTSYPFLGNASYWGDFLYQRKMRKLSQRNIKLKGIS
jgi:TPR repeat protein